MARQSRADQTDRLCWRQVVIMMNRAEPGSGWMNSRHDPPPPVRSEPDIDWKQANRLAFQALTSRNLVRPGRQSGMFHCPFQARHSNADRNPSMSISLTTFPAYCHGCHWGSGKPGGTALRLYAELTIGSYDGQAWKQAALELLGLNRN